MHKLWSLEIFLVLFIVKVCPTLNGSKTIDPKSSTKFLNLSNMHYKVHVNYLSSLRHPVQLLNTWFDQYVVSIQCNRLRFDLLVWVVDKIIFLSFWKQPISSACVLTCLLLSWKIIYSSRRMHLGNFRVVPFKRIFLYWVVHDSHFLCVAFD